ncbi:hypothetical protein [Streptomyces rishiriensis]|uniref:hypothetical protein n=1 Tax=Streptomyces rishiriensis TaxID=68264 RepID=UPI0037D3733D
MTDNRQPEAAGLPDAITGPYLRERALQGSKFQHVSSEIASIVHYDGGGCSLVTSGGTEQLVPRRSWWARPVSVCEIARGRHTTVFTVALPAANGATYFRTKVTLRWEVTDYRRVAEVRLTSIERDLGPEIVSRLRRVSGRFAVEDVQRANHAILAETESGRWTDLGADVGLRTSLFVEVDTDELRIGQVAEERKQAAEAESVARRFEEFSHLPTGTAEERLKYLMAMGNREEVAEVIAMMREDEAQGRRETREFFLRMLGQGRITSPELEAFLRTKVLGSMAQGGGFTPPAVAAPYTPPPRELTGPRSEPHDTPPWPNADRMDRHRQPEPAVAEPYDREPYDRKAYDPEPYAPKPDERKPYERKPYEAEYRAPEPDRAEYRPPGPAYEEEESPDPVPTYYPEPYSPDPVPTYYPEPYSPDPHGRTVYDETGRRRRRDDDYWDATPQSEDDGQGGHHRRSPR